MAQSELMAAAERAWDRYVAEAGALIDKAKGEHALVIGHPDGSRTTTFHPSRAAATSALASHLESTGGSGHAVIAPKGKEHMVHPVPVHMPGHGGGGHGFHGNQYTKAFDPRKQLIEAGPPDEWSGGVAAALGPERRAACVAEWRAMSPAEQAAVRAQWEAKMDGMLKAGMRLHKGGGRAKKQNYQGIQLRLDRPKGYVQEGKAAGGKKWRRVYLYDYGYIPRTEGGDGEGLDVFLGPDKTAPDAHWATQVKSKDGTFDEYKCFLGFPSLEHAKLAYGLHIPMHLCKGWHTMSVAKMKALLGQRPDEVIKASIQMEATTTMGTTNVRKDDAAPPADGAAAPPGTDTGIGEGLGTAGADIVSIAADRLKQIADAIEANGGNFDAGVQSEVAAVIALLEAVCPSEDVDEGVDMAAGEEKRMNDFMTKAVAAVANIRKEKDPVLKAARALLLRKALADAATAFSNAGEGASVPEFHDPAQLLPQEVSTPAASNAIGSYAQDGQGYSGTVNQGTTTAGSALFTEKLAKLNVAIQSLTGRGPEKDLTASAGDVGKAEAAATHKAAWTAAYVNDLPDGAFLYIEPGGSTDQDGRTTPRDLRHFPYKDANGAVDLPHLRDALARIPLAGIPDDKKKELEAHARSLLDGAEKADTSNVQKSERGDAGWPDDMSSPDFMRATGTGRKPKVFGYDNIPGKLLRATRPAAE